MRVAHDAAGPLGDFDQQLVADVAAALIVDRLEFVDIEEQDRDGPPTCAFEVLDGRSKVRQPRQLVISRQRSGRVRQRLAGGDVDMEHDKAGAQQRGTRLSAVNKDYQEQSSRIRQTFTATYGGTSIWGDQSPSPATRVGQPRTANEAIWRFALS